MTEAKRKFNDLPEDDRLMLTDQLIRFGLLDTEGFVTEEGEMLIAGESCSAESPMLELLGTDILPGRIRFMFKLSERWMSQHVKAQYELVQDLALTQFNPDVSGVVIVNVYDRDVLAERQILMEPMLGNDEPLCE